MPKGTKGNSSRGKRKVNKSLSQEETRREKSKSMNQTMATEEETRPKEEMVASNIQGSNSDISSSPARGESPSRNRSRSPGVLPPDVEFPSHLDLNKVVDAMNALGVSRKRHPGPQDLTPLRVSLLAPYMHPDFLYQRIHLETRKTIKKIPIVCNAYSFTSYVPIDLKFDPLFYCGVLYDVYCDATGNNNRSTVIKKILSFKIKRREESLLSEEDKMKYMMKWKIDSDTVIKRFTWVRPLIERYADMPSEKAWPAISSFVNQQPDEWKQDGLQ